MIVRFLQSRGWRKFRRNRLALAALGVIGLYVSVAVAVLVFGLFTLEETMERVGPRAVPGFFLTQSAEKRLEDALLYVEDIEQALRRAEPVDALARVRYAERHLADLPPNVFRHRIERIDEVYESLAQYPNLNEAPEALPRVTEIEETVESMFAPLSGWDGWKYKFKLLLGLDRQGRSISVRAVYSIRVAILVGVVTGLVSVLFGSLLGAAAAFFAGWVDHLVIWLYSTFSSIPNLVLLFVLVLMFQGSVVDGTLIPVYAAFCMTFWIGPCRVIRGEALKIKELEYVHAATIIGFGRGRVLLRHILPNTAHLMFINFSLLFIGAVKSEVILSFLGLGVKKGPSWGIMINQSGQEVINGFFWQIGTATVFMFGLVLAFNILTDALQDALDPRHV